MAALQARSLGPGPGPGPGLGLGSVPALEVKLAALALLLTVSLLFGISPLLLVRCAHNTEVRGRVLSFTSCFAGGVFFATCLLDLLPDYLDGINKAFDSAGITLEFPLPEFIIAMGFFLVLILEQILLSFRLSSSSSSSDERRALLDSASSSSVQSDPHHHHHHHHHQLDFSSQSALRAFILVFSLSLHSVFEGLAVGLVEEDKQIMELCLALLIHKSIIAVSLSFRLLQGRLRRSAVLGCLLLFALMSPLGVGVGVALTGASRSSPRQQMVRCVLEGLSGGTFFYITFMEILPHELHPHSRHNMAKVCALLLGFALVTAVLFIKL